MVIKSSTGADQNLDQKLFYVIDRDGFCDARYTTLSLAHSTPLLGNAFLDSVFVKEKEAIAVIAYGE
jgi:hypothetical protein